MIQISLTRGKTALIDDVDYELVQSFSWNFSSCGYKNGKGYVASTDRGKTIYMHRLILNAPRGVQVDHIDGNGLNNQRYNLRLCTPTENSCHRQTTNSTGYKGVAKEINGKYSTRIAINGKQYRISQFETPEEAAMAYNQAAYELHKDFAFIN